MINLQSHYSLKNHNTFGVDVSADLFVSVDSVKELREAVAIAREKNLPLMILGGGSNILFTQDFAGLVAAVKLKGITTETVNENEVLVSASAGENWHGFVEFCLEQNFGGLENLSLIPGNVGTAPMQNIGAYGTEIKDTFERCKVYNLENDLIEYFSAEQCRFGYRESVFKREAKGKYVILEVTFRLTRRDHQIKTEYGAIKDELKKSGIENPTIQQVAAAVITIRKSKLPDPKELGNAGSFFKNPSIPQKQFIELQRRYPKIPFYPAGELVKIPAGWLMEQSGWKGKQVGNVASHHQQSLVLINKTGLATGQEILAFSTMVINSIKEKFGITLEREVNIL